MGQTMVVSQPEGSDEADRSGASRGPSELSLVCIRDLPDSLCGIVVLVPVCRVVMSGICSIASCCCWSVRAMTSRGRPAAVSSAAGGSPFLLTMRYCR